MQHCDRSTSISPIHSKAQSSSQSSIQAIGIPIAIAIVTLWFISLCGLLQIPLVPENWQFIGFGIGLRTVLQTGLFITAHDAMHGSIVPRQPHLNRKIGQVLLYLYAFLSYDACRQRHFEHHHCPTQVGDPDFHDDQRFSVWYCNFMGQYLDAQQGWRVVMTIATVLTVFQLWHPTLLLNLLLFWLLPLVLSSFQLFYFGVYLPHRKSPKGYLDRHCASSLPAPIWLSFLMCYHFGYHWEHHEYPHLPWYQLPKVAKCITG